MLGNTEGARLLWLIRLLVFLLLALNVGHVAAQGQPQVLKYLYIPGSTTYLPIFVGIDRGMFAAEGISLELISGGNAAAIQTAIATGDIDTTHNDIPFWAALSQQGIDVGTVGAYLYVNRYLVLPTKDTTTPRPSTSGVTWKETLVGLKGKTVGVLPGYGRAHFSALLRMAGLDPDREVSLVNLGTVASQVTAMDQGQIDGLVTVAVWAYSVTTSTKSDLVLDIVTQGPPEAKAGFLTATGIRRSTVAKFPGLLDRYARALEKSVAYIRNPANMNDLMALSTKYGVKVSDPRILSELVRLVQRDLYSTVKRTDIESATKWAADTGQIKAQTPPPNLIVLKGLVN